MYTVRVYVHDEIVYKMRHDTYQGALENAQNQAQEFGLSWMKRYQNSGGLIMMSDDDTVWLSLS